MPSPTQVASGRSLLNLLDADFPTRCFLFLQKAPRLPTVSSSSYILTGALLEAETDAPLVGLLVEAYDVDAAHDRRLGGTLTDANGAFTLTINEPLDEAEPPTVRVTAFVDGRSEVIHQTDALTVNTSPYDLGRLKVVPNRPRRAVPAYTSALGHELPEASAPANAELPFKRRFPNLSAHRPPDELLEHLG